MSRATRQSRIFGSWWPLCASLPLDVSNLCCGVAVGGARQPSLSVLEIYPEGWILGFSRAFVGWTRWYHWCIVVFIRFPASKLQPSPQVENPFLWPLLSMCSMCSSKSNTHVRRTGTQSLSLSRAERASQQAVSAPFCGLCALCLHVLFCVACPCPVPGGRGVGFLAHMRCTRESSCKDAPVEFMCTSFIICLS